MIQVPPGGLSDLISRAVGDEVTRMLGQPVIVESKPGAAGKIAIQAMLNAPKDGHTFALVTASSMTINPLVDPAIGYDPLRDIQPLTVAVRTPLVVLIHPSVPARSMQELVAYAKANPGKLAYGSFGIGSSAHLWTEEWLMTLDISATHIPYKGEAPVLTDLVAGRIQLHIGSGTSKPLVDGGKLVALATSGTERWDFFPNVPSYPETGIDELKNYSYYVWFGFVAAAGNPGAAVAKLQDALIKALRTPKVEKMLALRGLKAVGSTSREFETAIHAELERNRKVVASGRVKLE